jgi:hypothetical protein
VIRLCQQIKEGNDHLNVIHISLQISRQNEKKSKINKRKINNNNSTINLVQEAYVCIFLDLGFICHLEFCHYKFRSLP